MKAVMMCIPKIHERLTETECLAQLAEEAAELSQAALKLRRAIDGANPTPRPAEICRSDLLEEAADVLLCPMVCGVPACETEGMRMDAMILRKALRWVDRLEAAHDEMPL